MGMPGLVSRASEATVAAAVNMVLPNADVVRITGTAAIANMTPPNTGQISDSVVILIPTGGNCTTVATGNIALAATLTNLVAKVMVYSQKDKKWY